MNNTCVKTIAPTLPIEVELEQFSKTIDLLISLLKKETKTWKGFKEKKSQKAAEILMSEKEKLCVEYQKQVEAFLSPKKILLFKSSLKESLRKKIRLLDHLTQENKRIINDPMIKRTFLLNASKKMPPDNIYPPLLWKGHCQ